MGTLFDQSERKSFCISKARILDLIDDLKAVSEETKLDISLVIQIWQIAELECQNALYHQNGDIFDEQIQGIGELLRELNYNLLEISEHFVPEIKEGE